MNETYAIVHRVSFESQFLNASTDLNDLKRRAENYLRDGEWGTVELFRCMGSEVDLILTCRTDDNDNIVWE